METRSLGGNQEQPHSPTSQPDSAGLQYKYDQAGLEVVHNDPEVVPTSDAPEVVNPHHQAWQHAQYSQQKAWEQAGYSPGHPSPGVTSVATTPYDYNSYNSYDQKPPLPPVGTGKSDRIWGLKRQHFWIALAVAVFFIVVAVALGAGLGIALNHNSSNSSATQTQSGPYILGTTTLPAATATATTTASGLDIQCPTANETLYVSGAAGGSSKSFLLLCNRDYNAADGAADLTNLPTNNMAACIDECAKNSACTSVGWGNYMGQYVCWLKSAIGKPNNTPGWYFAILEPGV